MVVRKTQTSKKNRRSYSRPIQARNQQYKSTWSQVNPAMELTWPNFDRRLRKNRTVLKSISPSKCKHSRSRSRSLTQNLSSASFWPSNRRCRTANLSRSSRPSYALLQSSLSLDGEMLSTNCSNSWAMAQEPTAWSGGLMLYRRLRWRKFSCRSTSGMCEYNRLSLGDCFNLSLDSHITIYLLKSLATLAG